VSPTTGGALSVYELHFQKLKIFFGINRRIRGDPIRTLRHRQSPPAAFTGASILRCLLVYEKEEPTFKNLKVGNLPLVLKDMIDGRTTPSAN
jgi:hypothetical protein